MNSILKSKIKESGLKHKFLAEKIGVNAMQFSKCFHGERFLDPEKEKELKEYLDKLPK